MDVTQKQMNVLAALPEDGAPVKRQDVSRQTGIGADPLSKYLGNLVAAGAVKKVGHGWYSRVAGVTYAVYSPVELNQLRAKELRELAALVKTDKSWHVDCKLSNAQQREAVRLYAQKVPRSQIAKRIGVNKSDLITFLLRSGLGL